MADTVQITALRLIDRAVDLLFQQLRVADDRLERGPEFMAQELDLRRARREPDFQIAIELAELLILNANIFIAEAIARLAGLSRSSAHFGGSLFPPWLHRRDELGVERRQLGKHPLCKSRA